MKGNVFTQVQMPSVDSNVFDMSHDYKLSFKMGQLVPTTVMEVLPGDRFNISTQNMLRFAPLVSPVMHRVRVTTHYYFVPNRILWADWENFITEKADVQHPYVEIDNVSKGSLCDYIGLPVGSTEAPFRFNPLALSAYLKIYDEWYRDQNLQNEKWTPLVSGDNTTALSLYSQDGPLARAWMHDYFTSALPFAQKGDTVQVPLTAEDNVPVEWQTTQNGGSWVDPVTGIPFSTGDAGQSPGPVPLIGSSTVNGDPASYDPRGSLVVDIQQDAVDINTLRRAFRLQEYLEKMARAGSRYIELIMSFFGVKSSDARLQRPEYFGGDSQFMVISEVLSTAENTEANVPVGQMAGHGISVGGGNRFSFTAEEHGWIIGIISVTPDTAYQQGIHRQFTRFDPLDYANPTFGNLGEQEILNKEIFLQGNSSDDLTFGYIPRYAEYKFLNSRVAGDFRTNLSFWHLGRLFDSLPLLNDDFIRCNPRNDIFAVTDENEDHIYAHIFHDIQSVRKLPKFGIPSI